MRSLESETKKNSTEYILDFGDAGGLLLAGDASRTSCSQCGFTCVSNGTGTVSARLYRVGTGATFRYGNGMEYLSVVSALSVAGIFVRLFFRWCDLAALLGDSVRSGCILFDQLLFGDIWFLWYLACRCILWFANVGYISLFFTAGSFCVGNVRSDSDAVLWERTASCPGILWKSVLASFWCGFWDSVGRRVWRFMVDTQAFGIDIDINTKESGSCERS